MTENAIKHKCGDLNMHWYAPGAESNTCVCGQVPCEMFFSFPCDCGQSQYRHPVHNPDCAHVKWAERLNQWIKEHPELNPSLDESHPEVRASCLG